MSNFTAAVTISANGPIPGDDVVSALLPFSAVWTTTGDGRADVILSLDATNLLDATTRALVLVERATHVPALRVAVATSAEFDREVDARAETTLSVSEAAERLGTTRQAVHQRIRSGSLPARRSGHSYAIPETAVERLLSERA
ncbi:helix-turn-helix domain-containing protein [Cellulosimicrobium sp. TH-20]|uniref:helix-turn-helix domain-containing protein n=1 Tax=Cellulosimicrobium sp. TH-20 TaxID=1980001 RepID=UPI0016435897|nr:helix-turn-helix domain-containing protein [Cellulosimicrobium sp. TH-20]